MKDRQNFGLLVLLYSALFAVYLLLCSKSTLGFKGVLLFTAAISVPCFLNFPLLSDDFYRFVWDGQLFVHGVNPYLHLPSAIPEFDFLEVFPNLNSPDYFSVYPPLNQLCFALASFFSGESILLNVFFLRLILFCALIASVFFLQAIFTLKGYENKLSLFAFNPLVVLESVGNLHFELLMLSFLLGAYFLYLKRKKIFGAAMLFGFAVSVKLVPLILLPLIVKKLGIKRGLSFVGVAFLINVLLFIPFAERLFFLHFADSLELYFHSFEFNASLYYLVRELGFWLSGFNLIYYLGPILGLISFVGILIISWRVKNFEVAAISILFLYLLLSTTVHPWYIIPLFGISMLTKFKFPLYWTGLIVLSYFAYKGLKVSENLIFVGFEYLILFFIAFSEYRLQNGKEAKGLI